MTETGRRRALSAFEPHQREFVRRIRELADIVGGPGCSVRQLAETCLVSRSESGRLINGESSLHSAETLHARAGEIAGIAQLPVSLDQLRELFRVSKGPCAHCPAVRIAVPEGGGSAPCAPVASPEIPGRPVAGPPGSADRQGTGNTTSWSGLADVIRHLGAGKATDAAGILRHTALAVDPAETAAAIDACYGQGLNDAANMLIVYAAQRRTRDIMRIARVLINDGHHTGAGELLNLAIAS